MNCQWSPWSKFGDCSKTCGGGFQKRTRKIESYRSGTECIGKREHQRECATQCCYNDCYWGSWTHFGECSNSCGEGTKKRTRQLKPSKKCKSKVCLSSPQNATETRKCKNIKCAHDSINVGLITLKYTNPTVNLSLPSFDPSFNENEDFYVDENATKLVFV